MLIATEGKPGLLYPVDNDILWQHCFGDAALLDNKANRVIVNTLLQAHSESADFCQPLKKRSK